MGRPPRMDLLGLGRLLRALAEKPRTQDEVCEILGIDNFEPRGHRYLGYLRDLGINVYSRDRVCYLDGGRSIDAIGAHFIALEASLRDEIATLQAQLATLQARLRGIAHIATRGEQ